MKQYYTLTAGCILLSTYHLTSKEHAQGLLFDQHFQVNSQIIVVNKLDKYYL